MGNVILWTLTICFVIYCAGCFIRKLPELYNSILQTKLMMQESKKQYDTKKNS